MRSFSALSDVLPLSWTPAEAWLLEQALATKREAEAHDPISQEIDEVLADVRVACRLQPDGGLHLAVCVFSYSEKGPQTSFALQVLEDVLNAGCEISADDRALLIRHLLELRKSSRYANKVKVVLRAMQGDLSPTSSPPSSPHSPNSPHNMSFHSTSTSSRSPGRLLTSSASLPNILDSKPASPKTAREPLHWPPTLQDREFFPKDKPQASMPWYRPRPINLQPGTPLFGGNQFAIPTGYHRRDGRAFFIEYAKAHPSTF